MNTLHTLSGLQMRILIDEFWHSNFFELLRFFLFLELLELYKKMFEPNYYGSHTTVYRGSISPYDALLGG